jgi:phosphate-selective porin OprO/OprP
MFRNLVAWLLLGCIGLAAASLEVRGQDTFPPSSNSDAKTAGKNESNQDDLKSRVDRLERQNQSLLKYLQELQTRQNAMSPDASALPEPRPGSPAWDYPPPLSSIILNPGQLPTRKSDPAADPSLSLTAFQPNVFDQGIGPMKLDTAKREYVVSPSPVLQGRWSNLLLFESPDGGTVFHIGGREQFDPVWITAPQNVQTGKGGTGPLQDGMGFRRARLQADATVYEFIDMKAEFDFLNTTGSPPINTPVITDLWMQIRELPYVGNLRAGYVKPLIGLEHLTSSRFLEFMERSYSFDAFTSSENNGFQPGIYFFNWTEDLRATWALGFFKTSQSIFAWTVGRGYNTSGRATWLPLWEDDGRYFMHLGLSGGYGGTDNGVDQIRARGLIRNGPAALQNILAISKLQADEMGFVNPEFLLNLGPFSIQSEYTGNWVQGVHKILQTPTQTNVPVNNITFYGQSAYVEFLYFLTGESRTYNRYEAVPWRVLPYRPFYFVRGRNGQNLFSSGAWQIGVRYSYLNLTNHGVNGGILNAVTLGLNWFLNPNFKLQFNFDIDQRSIPNSTASGNVYTGGMRFAWDF